MKTNIINTDQAKKEMEPFFSHVIQLLVHVTPKMFLANIIKMSFACTKTEADERTKKLIDADKLNASLPIL